MDGTTKAIAPGDSRSRLLFFLVQEPFEDRDVEEQVQRWSQGTSCKKHRVDDPVAPLVLLTPGRVHGLDGLFFGLEDF